MQPIDDGQGTRATRRDVLKSAGALAAAGLASLPAASAEAPALLGGTPAVQGSERDHADAARWPLYGPEEEKAVLDLLRNPGYGPIAALESDWKQFLDVPHAKAHCNGTSAIASMLFALDLPPGSEVLVPSYTFFATIVPMRMFGLVPAFVDVNPRTLNLDLDDARKRLTKNTRAIFPVHWMGLPCPMDEVVDFAGRHGLIAFEDAAHAHGASYKGKKMGAWGRMSIFSYQASKPLPALEGGMGVYQDRADFERAATFGHYDAPATFPQDSPYRKFAGTGLGMKFRMNPLAAALARAQLRTLDEGNRRGIARIRALNDRIGHLPGLVEPTMKPGTDRIYYSSNILFLDEAKAGISRDALIKALRAEGVRARAHRYPLQHAMALYREASLWHHAPAIPDLPGSEQANNTAISMPYFTREAPELIEQYARAFEKVWAHRDRLA